MQTSKKKSGGYIGLFSLVMINIVLVANLRFVPHISNVTFYTVFVSILAGLFFFFPICMIVAELYPIWSERGGVYHWVTKAFNDKVGFVAVFLQWGVVLLLTLLLLGFATTCFAFVFTPTIEDGISLASNKYYIVLSIIVFNWIIIFINKKGLHLTKKFSVIGTIFGILIPLLTLIFLTFIYLYKGNISHFSLSSAKVFPDMSNIHNLNLAFSMFVFFLGIEIAAGYGRDILKPNKYPRVILISSVLIFIILILTILSISIMLNEKTGYFAIDLNIILTKLFPDYNLYLFIRIFLLVFGIGTLGCMSTWITAASKGFVYVFEENSLLCWFSKKNKNDVPFRLLILQAVIITLLCLSFALQSTIYLADVMLSQFVMQMYLIVYIIVFISAIKLRYRYPDIPRPFKIPFGNVGIWILGVIGIIGSCIAILTGFYLPLQLTGKNYPLIVAVFFVLIILIVLILPAIIYSKNIKLLIFDKSDNSNNKEYKIALTLVVLGIAAYFVKYFLNIILTRHLGAHEYGDLAVFLKLVVILSLLILVGTNNSAKKYLSKYFNKRDINNSIDFIKWNFHIVYKAFIIYILFLFVLYILMGVLHVLNIKDFFSHHYVFYYISVVPLASVAVLFSSYILSNKWPVLFFFFRKIAVFVVMLILIGGGILFYNVKINLNNIGIFLLVSYIIVIVAELVFISRISTEHNIFSGSIDFKGKVKKSKERKQWLSDSFRMIGSQLIFNLIWAIDLFILEGIHHSEHDVGYYAAMLVLINILLITPSAITTLLIPRITHFVSEKKFGELQNNINLINLMNIAILTILLILLLVFSETLLLFFGKGYNSAEIPFIILCFTYYIASVFVPAGKVLTFVETGLQFKVSVIELIIVIILGVVFTWFWGLTGIAVSVMISILFKSLCTYIILKRKLPIKPFTLF